MNAHPGAKTMMRVAVADPNASDAADGVAVAAAAACG